MGGARADWLERIADRVVCHAAKRKGAGASLICASGVSPSGEIHLGNLREVFTTHFVVEELLSRGLPAVHLHSWDDYDRFRKVPEGFPASMEAFVGRPLCDVPDPDEQHESWAARFIHQFERAAGELGVQARWVRQSEKYQAGAYRAGIERALDHRVALFDVLSRFMTLRTPEQIAELRASWWPVRIYSANTGTDDTTVLGWDPATSTLQYRCNSSGEALSTCLADESRVKLLWKIDWPMRWAVEQVDFEPGGEDHASPGSSYTVGAQVVSHFDWVAPSFEAYGFVGMAGRTKMSSSTGTGATPEFALGFLEPALVRWLYLRRPPRKKFNIEFGVDIWRQYDEWDALDRRVVADKATPLEARVHRLALHPSAGSLPSPAVRLPFRSLTAAADGSDGNREQVIRIAALSLEAPPDDLERALHPRLDRALGWVTQVLPDDERLSVRAEHDPAAFAALDATSQEAVRRLLAQMADHWSLSGLTSLVYGVPKDMAGLPRDTPPTPELKQAQRAFFVAVYQLLLGVETGPRLPTLLLSLGEPRVRRLLG